MAVYDPSDGEGKAEGCFGGVDVPQFVPALDKWFDRYKALGAELGFAVVDALHHFHGHGMNSVDPQNQYYDESNPQRWFATDCIHPNNFGHNELRRLFFEAIDWNYVATP